MLPALTPLQYLTLHLLFAGPQTARQLCEALHALGVRQIAVAFSRLMMRLVIANYVVPLSSTAEIDGRQVRRNLYQITDLGVLDWTAARKFYLNLAAPSHDLLPLVTDMGEFAVYDEKTRLRLTKAAFVKELSPWLRAVVQNATFLQRSKPTNGRKPGRDTALKRPLHHPANKALQILALQAGGADRVVGRGAALVEDLDLAAGLLGDADEHVEEILAGDVAGTTARDQDAAGLQAARRRDG